MSSYKPEDPKELSLRPTKIDPLNDLKCKDVARAGFEPATQGFSGLCSTD